MMRRTTGVLVGIAVAACVLGGCGGGGGGGGGNDGVITFVASAFSVNEDGTVIDLITLHRDGGTGDVSVTVTFADGSATSPADYDPTPIVVAWVAGDLTDKIIAVPIVDDSNDEPDETLTMTIGSPTGGAVVGTPGSATLTIVDDDVAGMVELTATAYVFSEASLLAEITVIRTGGMDGDISVTVTSSDGTANSDPFSVVEPVDYSPISTTAFFADQSTTPVVIAVSIVHDLLPEIDETFTVSLGNPTNGATIGAASSATVTILDDDDLLEIENPAMDINGFYGTSVAKIGQRLAIGAPGNFGGTGGVHVVNVDFGTEEGFHQGGPFSQAFGLALSSEGDTLAIGGLNRAWSFGGDAFLDVYSERFMVSNLDDGFGRVVLAHGTRLVVGAPDAQIGSAGLVAGKVYSYDEVTGAPLPVLEGVADNRFGAALARYGNDLLVGAPGNSGLVAVFTGSPWILDFSVANPFPQFPPTSFGASIDSNPATGAIYVGTPDGDTFAPNDGRVHIFDGGPPLTILPPGPPNSGGRFGANVFVMSSGRLCIQQPGHALGIGRVIVYDGAGAVTQLIPHPPPTAAGFGTSMCEFDGALVIGSPRSPALLQFGKVFIVKVL